MKKKTYLKSIILLLGIHSIVLPGDVTPLLKWVKKEDEEQIKTAFQKTIAVRAKGPEAKELASLVNKIAAHVKAGIKERFAKAITAKKTADKSVEAGREYVEAYVAYLHYVTGTHSAVMAKGGHPEHAGHGESKHEE